MNTVIRILNEVPSNIFNDCLLEISTIDWENPPVPDFRRLATIFKTSYSVHLRIHENPTGKPEPIHVKSAIIECQDTSILEKFQSTNNLIKWTAETVGGTKFGRIMLVKLLKHSGVPNHIDQGPYFEAYKRFHIPLITNENVVFTGSEDNKDYHMPARFLGQLNNRKIHGIDNRSDYDRVHLIMDIETSRKEYEF